MTRKFDDRYLAFVDVLGFRSIVKRMAKSDRLFETVRDALKRLNRQARQFRKYNSATRRRKGGALAALPKGDLQMTAFSDCYVLSETFPAWHVLAAVQALGARFLTEGILIRGAVVRGGAYHHGGVLFGPAVVEAYELESEVAKYPRILVTDEVRLNVWGYHQGLCKGQLLEQDVDGCWFVNLLVPPLSNWTALSDAAIARDLHDHLNAHERHVTLLEYSGISGT